MINLFDKKVDFEKASAFSHPVIIKLFKPVKTAIDKTRNHYLDSMGQLKRKERLYLTAETYTKLVAKEAADCKMNYIGDVFTRLMSLLILEIRAYNYEGSQFSSNSKDLINHKTINIIRKAPYFDPVVHAVIHDLELETAARRKEKGLISKVIMLEAYHKLTLGEQKKLKPLIDAYGAVVNLSELASNREKIYNPYLETLFDYEKTSFEFAFESIRGDKTVLKIAKKYASLLSKQYRHEKHDKKLFEAMGKKLSKVILGFTSFIQKPSKFTR
jgi:hypothetical protein